MQDVNRAGWLLGRDLGDLGGLGGLALRDGPLVVAGVAPGVASAGGQQQRTAFRTRLRQRLLAHGERTLGVVGAAVEAPAAPE